MTPEEVDLETALKLLSLPRTLGRTSGDAASRWWLTTAVSGRTSSAATKRVRCPTDCSPLDVTLGAGLGAAGPAEDARGGAAASKEPLKVFDASPVTGQPVRLLQGRYGPYVTDGDDQRLAAARHAAGGSHVRNTRSTCWQQRAAAGPSKRAGGGKAGGRRDGENRRDIGGEQRKSCRHERSCSIVVCTSSSESARSDFAGCARNGNADAGRNAITRRSR